MSLRTVHILFVVAATLLSFALAAFFLVSFRDHGGVSSLVFGLGWAALGLGLVVYGRRVVRKLRHLSALRS
jgi:hypothetical protein